MLFEILCTCGGLGLGYLLNEILLRRNKKIYPLIDAIKKRKLIAFLETDKAVYFRVIPKTYKNLGITKEKELIILPKSSVKPCVNLGGLLIARGDLYKSACVPQEVRKFISERLSDGWSEEDIAKFFEEIETIPSEQLKARYKALKDSKYYPESVESGNPTPVSKVDKQKYDIYVSLPSVVKDFIYTGLNRTSIHAMLRELVFQRELEKMGQRNWVKIAIAIFLVLLGIGFLIRFIGSTPAITSFFKPQMPARIAP